MREILRCAQDDGGAPSLLAAPFPIFSKRAAGRSVLQARFLQDAGQQVGRAPCQENRRGESEKL